MPPDTRSGAALPAGRIPRAGERALQRHRGRPTHVQPHRRHSGAASVPGADPGRSPRRHQHLRRQRFASDDDPAVADRSSLTRSWRFTRPLDEVEWPGTIEFISRRRCPPGMPLILAPGRIRQDPARTASRNGAGLAFEQSGPMVYQLGFRRRGPIERELRRFLRAQPALRRTDRQRHGHARRRKHCTGQRKSPWRLQRAQLSVAGRDLVFDWLPIFELLGTSKSSDVIREAGQIAALRPTKCRHDQAESCVLLHHGLARRSPHRPPELQSCPLPHATSELERRIGHTLSPVRRSTAAGTDGHFAVRGQAPKTRSISTIRRPAGAALRGRLSANSPTPARHSGCGASSRCSNGARAVARVRVTARAPGGGPARAVSPPFGARP